MESLEHAGGRLWHKKVCCGNHCNVILAITLPILKCISCEAHAGVAQHQPDHCAADFLITTDDDYNTVSGKSTNKFYKELPRH